MITKIKISVLTAGFILLSLAGCKKSSDSITNLPSINSENNKVVGEEWLLTGQGQRFRAVRQAKNGALYAVTDQGKLYKISKK